MNSGRRERWPVGGILTREGRVTGPLLLPREEEAEDFVAEFNRLYGPIGLELRRQKKSPSASGDADGDS